MGYISGRSSTGGNSSSSSGSGGGSGGSSGGWLDIVQTGLDAVGLVPVVGEWADGINAAIYLARGDYLNAGLSAAAMIPVVGLAATGAKYGVKAVNASVDIYKTSKGAFKAAKRANDIPVSAQPLRTFRVADKGSPSKQLRVYEFMNNKGQHIHIRRDLPKSYQDGGYQGPHYNAGPAGGKLNQHFYFNR